MRLKKLKLQMINTCLTLQPYIYEPCVSKESVKENFPGIESSDSEEVARKIGNTLWYSSAIATNF